MQACIGMKPMLSDKVVIVTGGATGIGEAICKVFARHGARVVVNGLPGDPVDEVVNEIGQAGGIATSCVADCGTGEGANGCIQTALAAYGRLDVLVCNAALFPEEAELQDFPLERYEELMHSNVDGVYLPVRLALPQLRKTKGCIITLGSEAGLVGQPKFVSYSATKGWVHAFTRSVAAEQAKYGVRANIVAPGPIDTEMTRPSKGHLSRMTAAMTVKSVPLGRRGTPEEVANVCLFLASELASYVTGAIYTVDGGQTASTGLSGIGSKDEEPEGTVALEHQHEGRGTLAP